MKDSVKYVAGVDVSNYRLESSILDETLESLYGTHPSFSFVVDSLNSHFGSMYSGSMLRFHSRSGTMCRALYDHLTDLVEKDSRPICTVLFNAVKHNGVVNADLTTCMRLLHESDYVQKQVGKTFVDKVWFRTQQVLRLGSVQQAKEFVDSYHKFPMREALQEQLMPLVGNYLSRVRSSGLPPGHRI